MTTPPQKFNVTFVHSHITFVTEKTYEGINTFIENNLPPKYRKLINIKIILAELKEFMPYFYWNKNYYSLEIKLSVFPKKEGVDIINILKECFLNKQTSFLEVIIHSIKFYESFTIENVKQTK